MVRECEVCEEVKETVSCEDGLYRCNDCCIEDGYDWQDGSYIGVVDLMDLKKKHDEEIDE